MVEVEVAQDAGIGMYGESSKRPAIASPPVHSIRRIAGMSERRRTAA